MQKSRNFHMIYWDLQKFLNKSFFDLAFTVSKNFVSTLGNLPIGQVMNYVFKIYCKYISISLFIYSLS